jgi:hypothetical protein
MKPKKGEFDGYVTCNTPIISKASIHPTDIAMAHISSIGATNKSSESQTSENALINEMYSMNWIM